MKNVAYSTVPSNHGSSNENQKGRKSYERKEAKVMAVKATKGRTPLPASKEMVPRSPVGKAMHHR